jgi:hypothetical protein
MGSTIVVVTTLLCLFLSSGHPSKAADIVFDVIGIPLLPGVGFVSMFWGSWQAIHQGQIVWIPPVSIVVDSLMVFGIWEFLPSRKSLEADVHTTLHLNG